MSLPWHIPLEAIKKLKTKTCPEPTLLKHYCSLDIHGNPREELQTALMCDVGPNNIEPGNIQRLIAAGMTIAKLNVHDLEPEVRNQLIQSVRQAVYNYSTELDYVYPLALIVDICGPDIKTGSLNGGIRATIELNKDQKIRLSTDTNWRECGTTECIYVGWDHLTDLNPNDIIYIDSLSPERIKLVVLEVDDDSVFCMIESGGTVGSQMAVRILQIPREIHMTQEKGDSLESIACSDKSSQQSYEHMEQQVQWAVRADIDAVLISAVQTAEDIRIIKQFLPTNAKHILIFASIDTVLGLNNINEIITESDGIYLDRNILCCDLPIEKICIAQKVIVAKCKAMGKPCICKAVINECIPSMCINDITNLIIDGVDVLALEFHYNSPLYKLAQSQDCLRMIETCISAATVICKNAERIEWVPCMYSNLELTQSLLEEPTKAICVSAIELAMRSNAVVIICLTSSGRTAKTLSHVSSTCPIVAVTRACYTARQLRFWKGIHAMHYFETPKENWTIEIEFRVRAALDYCKAKRIVKAGDPYVLVTGSRRGVGYCDSTRLLYASALDTVPIE